MVGANGWPKVQLEIRNEEIVGLGNDFCRSVDKINSLYEVRDFLSNLSNYEQASRIYTEVYPYQGLDDSVGWTFNVKGILNGSVPENLHCTRRDAMVQFGPWWTRAHIEIGGDDSISKTIVGEKLFLICGSYKTSIGFDNVMGTPQYFMDLIKRGPKASDLGTDIWFYLSNKSSVLCQPSLCSHAVLTMSEGVSLVTGWEAQDLQNVDVGRRTFNSFGIGVHKGAVKKILNDKGKSGLLKWALERDIKVGGSTDVTEHVQSLVRNDLIIKTKSYKRKSKWGGGGVNEKQPEMTTSWTTRAHSSILFSRQRIQVSFRVSCDFFDIAFLLTFLMYKWLPDIIGLLLRSHISAV